MRFTYDPDADAAFVYIVDLIHPGQAARSEMCDLEIREGAVILVLDADERIIGIELLGASRLVPKEVLDRADRPDGRRQ